MWVLNNITRVQYETVYKGTVGMDAIELFTRYPSSWQEAQEVFLPSKLWRLNFMYKVVDKDEKLVRFEMKWGQHYVYASYLTYPRLIILKSRQQGISTLFLLVFLDDILTVSNAEAGLISKDRDGSMKLKTKVDIAYKYLDASFARLLGLGKDASSSSKITFSNESTLRIATSFRSGTLGRLHISELGYIAKSNPTRLTELISGTLQAIKVGKPVVIESTAEGDNAFKDMWDATVSKPKGKQYLGVFLSWVLDPDCHSDVPYDLMNAEYSDYFTELALEFELHYGYSADLQITQKQWWVMQFEEFGFNKVHMGKEYPGYPKEAFEASTSGAYFADAYRLYVKDKKEDYSLYDPNLPVYIGADLGWNDTMVFIFFQLGTKEFRVIDEYHNSGETLRHYCKVIHSRGYNIELLYLPHDASSKNYVTGTNALSVFRGAGFNCYVVPRTGSVVEDIDIVRNIMPYMWLDPSTCGYIQTMLIKYSKEWNDKLGCWRDKPKHDEWSNPADALRTGVIGSLQKLSSMEATHKKVMGEVSTSKFVSVVDGIAF